MSQNVRILTECFEERGFTEMLMFVHTTEYQYVDFVLSELNAIELLHTKRCFKSPESAAHAVHILYAERAHSTENMLKIVYDTKDILVFALARDSSNTRHSYAPVVVVLKL